jgi:hypothetical protein
MDLWGMRLLGICQKKLLGLYKFIIGAFVRNNQEEHNCCGCHLSPLHHHAQNRWGSSVIAHAVQLTMSGPPVGVGVGAIIEPNTEDPGSPKTP